MKQNVFTSEQYITAYRLYLLNTSFLEHAELTSL